MWEDFPRKVTSRLAYVETHAAVSSAQRAGRLSRRDAGKALTCFAEHWGEIAIVDAGRDVVAHAAQLAARRGLRGYDAVHLASALAVSDDLNDALMITWDERLGEASYAEGISVVRTSRLA